MSEVSNAERNKRALILLAVSLVAGAILEFGFPSSTTAPAASIASDPAALQLRLTRLRQIAATAPVREVQMKQVSADLTDRERGIIQADTAAQAQATLLEIANRIGRTEQLDVRGGDFAAPRPFGDYGMVYATISFECHIEQLVNFLADLSREPQLVVPAEERIAAGNAKDKTMTVRMVLAGVVAKKLVPEKKGLATF
jgi:uncharacterized membrane protein